VTTDADPVSYLLIERGWEVVGSDGGRVGDVDEVLADLASDIFDGLTVDQGLTKAPRYVPAERVAQIVEGRVVLDAPADAFESEFPEWTGTPPG
jgi:uncharacterized protein YrrD